METDGQAQTSSLVSSGREREFLHMPLISKRNFCISSYHAFLTRRCFRQTLLPVLALFNTNLAFYFWSEGIKDANPKTAAVFFGLIPLAAAITENAVFGERIALYHIVGASLIFLGILLYVLTKRKSPRVEVSQETGAS
jgi:multidrug transporter EmrE-like cation transporter